MLDLTQFEGHTPGPWVALTENRPDAIVKLSHGGEILVGDLIYADENNTANARLIAAAPELLEEMKMLREALKKCEDAMNSIRWGYDGDCGATEAIAYIVDMAMKGESDDDKN